MRDPDPDEREDVELLVPFTDQTPSFVNGFECGSVWEALGRDLAPPPMMIHAENQVVIALIAKARGFLTSFHPTTELPGRLDAHFLYVGGGA